MNSRQHAAQRFVQLLRWVAADHRDQCREGPRLGHSLSSPSRKLSSRCCSAPVKESCTKSWIATSIDENELRILARRILGRDMRDQQAGVMMYQEDMLDLIDERMLEHDLGEGDCRSARLPSAI